MIGDSDAEPEVQRVECGEILSKPGLVFLLFFLWKCFDNQEWTFNFKQQFQTTDVINSKYNLQSDVKGHQTK